MELPHQRRLPEDVREDAKKLLKLKGNKHLIREELQNRTNQVIRLKDLQNLNQENKKQYKNNIEIAVGLVNQKFKSDCQLLIDHANVFKGLLFCTPSMKSTVNAFPELLCIDATYKLNSIRAPVYLILVEDGNGESVVVAVALLVSEEKEKYFMVFEEI
ncbi:hypothetical protein NQ317_011992 [Molorchus minor]|uniref:ZSWIM1/3 RNaseH-like domain-containing protein n=1 Tax=Molorchus minor TaxID=1323400 RepID=A0ABQ9JB20_9CUCU|nr:hypothetical protein NQ317_011992 [Molorchus minor]